LDEVYLAVWVLLAMCGGCLSASANRIITFKASENVVRVYAFEFILILYTRHEGRLATSISTGLTSKEEKGTKSQPVGGSRMLASYAATDDVRLQLLSSAKKKERSSGKAEEAKKKKKANKERNELSCSWVVMRLPCRRN
jgi:hypothetical protein